MTFGRFCRHYNRCLFACGWFFRGWYTARRPSEPWRVVYMVLCLTIETYDPCQSQSSLQVIFQGVAHSKEAVQSLRSRTQPASRSTSGTPQGSGLVRPAPSFLFCFSCAPFEISCPSLCSFFGPVLPLFLYGFASIFWFHFASVFSTRLLNAHNNETWWYLKDVSLCPCE